MKYTPQDKLDLLLRRVKAMTNMALQAEASLGDEDDLAAMAAGIAALGLQAQQEIADE